MTTHLAVGLLLAGVAAAQGVRPGVADGRAREHLARKFSTHGADAWPDIAQVSKAASRQSSWMVKSSGTVGIPPTNQRPLPIDRSGYVK